MNVIAPDYKKNKAQKNSWWPPVDLPEDAKQACKNAAWAAYFVAIMTGLIVVLGGALGNSIANVDAWAFIDVAIMAVGGFFLQNYQSRIAAIVIFADFVYGKIYFVSVGQHINLGGWIVAFALGLYMLHGVRGAFAYYRIKKVQPAAN